MISKRQFDIEYTMQDGILHITSNVTWKPGMKPMKLVELMFEIAETEKAIGIYFYDCATGLPEKITMQEVYEVAEKLMDPKPIAIVPGPNVEPLKSERFNALNVVFNEFGYLMRSFSTKEDALDWLMTA